MKVGPTPPGYLLLDLYPTKHGEHLGLIVGPIPHGHQYLIKHGEHLGERLGQIHGEAQELLVKIPGMSRGISPGGIRGVLR